MRGPYRQYGTDKDIEATVGVRLNFDGYKITILRAGGSNQRYNSAVMEAIRKSADVDAIDVTQPMTEGAAIELLATVYADTIVIAWEDVIDENDNPLECTRENIIKVFTELHDLFNRVREKAMLHTTFQKRRDDKSVKKSENT